MYRFFQTYYFSLLYIRKKFNVTYFHNRQRQNQSVNKNAMKNKAIFILIVRKSYIGSIKLTKKPPNKIAGIGIKKI